MSHNDGRCARFTRVICNCSFNRLYCTLLRLGICLRSIIRSNRLPANNGARRGDCQPSFGIYTFAVLCRVLWLDDMFRFEFFVTDTVFHETNRDKMRVASLCILTRSLAVYCVGNFSKPDFLLSLIFHKNPKFN